MVCDVHTGAGLRRDDLLRPGGAGLIVAGGGMRGAFSIGALRALSDFGLSSTFDLCMANSAGAIAASYFLAGQADAIDERYWFHLQEQRIFNPWRPWRIVDVDRMIDAQFNGDAGLEVAALRASPTRLLVGLADAALRLPRYFCAQEMDEDELPELLKATIALPGLSNRRVLIRGRRYIDGGFVDPLPVNRMLALGPTSLLVVLTSPLIYGFVNDGLLRRSVIKALSIGQSRFVRTWIGTPNPLHDENLERLLAVQEIGAADPHLRISIIAPSERYPDFTRDPVILRKAFDDGYRLGLAYAESVTADRPSK